MTCPRVVAWFDLDAVYRCVLEAGHGGLHADGLRWFDNDGLQRPTELEGATNTIRYVRTISRPTGGQSHDGIAS